MRRVALALALVVAAPHVAQAGLWYYKWSCSGQCAPNQLAISGVSPGFATRDQCESVRWSDSRRQEFVAPGNLGGLTNCEEYDSPPSPDSSGSSGSTNPVPMQRLSVGISSGKGWRIRDATRETQGEQTYGLDLNFVAGAHPWLGVEMGGGIQLSSVTHPHYGSAPHSLLYAPITLGLTSAPRLFQSRSLDVRLDLGADLGALFHVGCGDCEADGLSTISLVGVLRAGFESYFGQNRGIGVFVGATLMLGKEGNMSDAVAPSAVEILPPTFLMRLAIAGRNHNLDW